MNGPVSFDRDLVLPSYGTYTHGILIVDNEFTVQGELVLESGATPYCYIQTGMTVACQATLQTPPEVTDAITNFFDLTPSIYDYTFTDTGVTVDLVTDSTTASTLSASDLASDAILAIQPFTSPQIFDVNTSSIDIGVKISEALTMTDSEATTAPFSIQFTVN